jgi:signal transduction histidine kinase
MSEAIDPRWPKVLSLTVHEFRTPLTVVSGYLRMVLTERAGTITEQQRRLLEEAAKSCGRLSALVDEVSELSNLEAGTLTFNRQQTDVRSAIRAAAARLPPLPDREVPIDVQLGDGAAMVHGDPVRLTQAFTSLLAALRREIITEDPLGVREARSGNGTLDLHIGDPEALESLAAGGDRPVFDEWRGGVGLSLAVARRIIEAHGGQLTAPPEGRKTGARVTLPPS